MRTRHPIERATETNGTAEPEDGGRRDSRNGSELTAAGHGALFEPRRTRDGAGVVNNVSNDDDDVADVGAGRTTALALATNSIVAGRRRPSRSGSRSSSLSVNAVTGTGTTITAADAAADAVANATREGNGHGPLDVEGKNGEGEPRVSFPWCVMGCFGSQSSKASQDDSKNQKRRSDAITRQLQKDKQVYRATHRLLLLGESYQTFLSSHLRKISSVNLTASSSTFDIFQAIDKHSPSINPALYKFISLYNLIRRKEIERAFKYREGKKENSVIDIASTFRVESKALFILTVTQRDFFF